MRKAKLAIWPGVTARRSARALLAILAIGLGCASPPKTVTDATAVAAQGPASPNEFIVLARVIKLGEIDSSALRVEPPQTFCELTLDPLSVEPPTDVIGRSGAKNKPLTVYAREMKCLANLRGTTLRLAVTFRGDERGGRWWVTRELRAR